MKEKKPQKTNWKELGYADLRHLPQSQRLPAAEIIIAGDAVETAIMILAHELGFADSTIMEIQHITPIGAVRIERIQLQHIVEKRQDARERYVKHALATMQNPLEIWSVAYEDDIGNEAWRYAYIGAFEGKVQMLVVVAQEKGKLLWNFMHSDSKTLNKHRHGECIYCRP
jgi:ABC-type cobalamin transport system permease subunit